MEENNGRKRVSINIGILKKEIDGGRKETIGTGWIKMIIEVESLTKNTDLYKEICKGCQDLVTGWNGDFLKKG